MTNANSSLGITDMSGTFKAGTANVNGGKYQEGYFLKLSGPALR